MQTGYPSIDKPWLKYYSGETLNVLPTGMSIYDYMRQCNQNHLHDVALLYQGRRITFEQMFQQIEIVARALVAISINVGDIVTLTLPTTPETVYLFYALNKLGAVANFIDPRTNITRIRKYILDTNSEYIFTIDKYSKAVMEAVQETRVKFGVILSAKTSLPVLMKCTYTMATLCAKNTGFDSISPTGKLFVSWKQFLAYSNSIATVDSAAFCANRPAGIVYTSGTTGIPKGAVFSNENLVAQAVNMSNAFFIEHRGRGCRFLNIMPPWLAYGLTCAMSTILCMGMQMDIIPQFNYTKFDTLLLKHKPEIILGVPTFFEEVIKSPKLKGVDLSFLKAIIVGGSPLNVGTEEKINAFLANHNAKIRISKGYGMTEMCAATTYTSKDACNSLGSVGIPMFLNNVAIVDPDTQQELKYNEVGEIYLTGPTRMLQYLGNEAETQKIFTDFRGDKWVKTSDFGCISENGEIFHRGRIKQIMIYEGHNVFPGSIEDVLSKHPAVSQVVVAGVVHKESLNNEVPTAFIVLHAGYEKSASIIDDFKAFSLLHLPQRDVAQAYVIVDAIPLTSNGKVDYTTLKQIAIG